MIQTWKGAEIQVESGIEGVKQVGVHGSGGGVAAHWRKGHVEEAEGLNWSGKKFRDSLNLEIQELQISRRLRVDEHF